MDEQPAVVSRKALINTVIFALFLVLALVCFFVFGREVERLL